MQSELFAYFENELFYLRELGHEFARAHPAEGFALRIDESVAASNRDPHVERLLQGVAYLNARLHHRLDDDFPQLSETLLNALYPYYLTPFPSCSIVQFGMDEGQLGKDAAKGEYLATHAPLEFRGPMSTAPLRYQTAYATHVLPIRIASAAFSNDRFFSPPGTRLREAAAALQINLETLSPEITFADLADHAAIPDAPSKDLSIRFFLHGHNQPKTAHALYDQLVKSNVRVVLCDPAVPESAVTLPPRSVVPVGFQQNEFLLPRDARVMQGYRLLHEYFSFPQKFHFVDICIPRSCLAGYGPRLQLIVMSSEENAELAEALQPDDLRLGCTPIVNLFPMRAEFARSYRQTEYRLVVDAGSPLDYDVFQIKTVRVVQHGKTVGEYKSFYDVYHGPEDNILGYWHASRRDDGGGAFQDVYLTLVDHRPHQATMENATVSVEFICSNRNLLTDELALRYDAKTARAGIPIQLLAERGEGKAHLVVRPTEALRRRGTTDWRWRLCSHLALNHLSLSDDREGAAALKEILSLYDVSESAIVAERIEGIVSAKTVSEPVTRRVAPGPHGFARGNRVRLAFQESSYPDGGLFLFASVLRHFFACYATINSFVETRYHTIERNKEHNSWPPLAGTRPLL